LTHKANIFQSILSRKIDILVHFTNNCNYWL